MTGLIIFLCVVSAILLMGMIGDKVERNRQNYMCAFCACVMAITAIAITIA